MDNFKQFCKGSTVHGLRHLVDENSNLLEKIAWACILSLATFLSFSYMQSYREDIDISPFVTSFSSIPIRDVPFPALSVRSTQAITSVPPWLNMASRILDNVKYDCLTEGEECMNHTRAIRQHSGNLVAYTVEKNLKNLQDIYNLELTEKESNMLCVLFMRLIGKPAYGLIHAMVELLEESSGTIDLKPLAVDIFRIPKNLAIIKIKQFLLNQGKNVTMSTISQARTALINSSKETKVKIFGFIVSQGNETPKLSLGAFIYYNSLLLYHKPGLYGLRNVIKDLLLRRTTFPEIGTIALDGYDAHLSKFQSCNSLSHYELSQCSAYKNKTNAVCCTMLNETLIHYEAFLAVMKYYMSPMTWAIQGNSYVRDIEEAIEMLPYERTDNKVLTQGLLPEIFHSRYFGNKSGSNSVTTCHFANIYSEGGITNTFNAPYFWNIHKENYFTRAYFNQIYRKVDQCNKSLEAGPLHVANNGQEYAFEAIIPPPEIGVQVIDLHSPFDVPDVNSRSISISPGKTYTISVTPSKIKVGSRLDKGDMEKLGCRSKQDHNLIIFQDYSQSKCLFECHLKSASRKCSCIPWNYPHIDNKLPVCLEFRYKCFQKALLSVKDENGSCDCPPACNRIQYTYHVDTAETNLASVCKNHWERMGLQKRQWIRNKVLRIREVTNAKDFLEEDFPPFPCYTLLSKMAFVQVYMGPPDVSVALTSLRATFPEHVATFGTQLDTCIVKSI